MYSDWLKSTMLHATSNKSALSQSRVITLLIDLFVRLAQGVGRCTSAPFINGTALLFIQDWTQGELKHHVTCNIQ